MVEKSFSQNSSLELNVKSPAQTQDCVYLVWNSLMALDKNVCDYEVFVNGKKEKYSARKQAKRLNSFLDSYKTSFYKAFSKKVTGLPNGMNATDVSFFCVQNLNANTDYDFKVCAVSSSGKTLYESSSITVKTKESGDVLSVERFGAKASKKISERTNLNGEKEFILANTKAIQSAIDSCPENGTVFVPKGIFMCGGLHLKSNMTLKIDGELVSSPFAEHYDYSFYMYPYYTDTRYWGMLNADGAENLVLCGSGIVDGNGWFSEDKDGKSSLDEKFYSEEGDDTKSPLLKFKKGNNKTVYTDGILAADCAESYFKIEGKSLENAETDDLRSAYSTRSTTVILRGVKGLVIDGLTFKNPANHMINLLNSQNITICNIKIFSYDVNNGDGIGLISSGSANIFNNFIDTGDDSIVFSAGVGKSAFEIEQDGVKNVEICGNYIHHGHGGVAFGSHTARGLEQIFVHDNIFNHTDIAFRIKSAPANGGYVKDVVFEDNAIACVNRPFSMSTEYSDAGTVSKYGAAERQAVFSDIIVRRCSVYKNSDYAIYIYADEKTPHHDILFSDIEFSKEGNHKQYIANCENFKIE